MTRGNVELQEQTLGLAEARFRTGLAPRLDVTQAESNLLATRSTVPDFERQVQQARYRIEVLTGQTPGAYRGWFESLAVAESPNIPEAISIGVPAELLRRRPDIRAAERRIAAQVAQIGVAEAERYPVFSLTGSLGLETLELGDLLEGRSITYGFGPSIRWNLFSGLQAKNRVLLAEAQAETLLTQYEQLILFALQEVESAFVGVQSEQDRQRVLRQAYEKAEESERLVKTLYRNGLTDFQNVLDTQRSLNDIQNALTLSEGLVAINLVRLYEALGGGWDAALRPLRRSTAGVVLRRRRGTRPGAGL